MAARPQKAPQKGPLVTEMDPGEGRRGIRIEQKEGAVRRDPRPVQKIIRFRPGPVRKGHGDPATGPATEGAPRSGKKLKGKVVTLMDVMVHADMVQVVPKYPGSRRHQ